MILITDATRDYVLTNRGSRAMPIERTMGRSPYAPLERRRDDSSVTGHRVELGADDVIPDGVVLDSVIPDSVIPDSVIPDSVIPDSVIPDSVIPDSVIPDSVIPDSVIPEMVASGATASQQVDAG